VALLGVDLGQSLICLVLRSFYIITAIPLVCRCCSSFPLLLFVISMCWNLSGIVLLDAVRYVLH